MFSEKDKHFTTGRGFEEAHKRLPVILLQARATPLSPSQWQEMLRTAVVPATLRQGGPATAGGSGGTPGGPNAGGNAQGVVVLDVRNAYEWDAGHFVGAQRPLEVPTLLCPSESTRLRVTCMQMRSCRSLPQEVVVS